MSYAFPPQAVVYATAFMQYFPRINNLVFINVVLEMLFISNEIITDVQSYIYKQKNKFS